MLPEREADEEFLVDSSIFFVPEAAWVDLEVVVAAFVAFSSRLRSSWFCARMTFSFSMYF